MELAFIIMRPFSPLEASASMRRIMEERIVEGEMCIRDRFSPKDEGRYAVIYTDDEEYARLPLDEDTTLRVETELGYNEIVIKDGYADCVEADCRDGVCVKHKEISMKDEAIVCLPHKLSLIHI